LHQRAFDFFGGVTEVVVPDKIEECRIEPGTKPRQRWVSGHSTLDRGGVAQAQVLLSGVSQPVYYRVAGAGQSAAPAGRQPRHVIRATGQAGAKAAPGQALSVRRMRRCSGQVTMTTGFEAIGSDVCCAGEERSDSSGEFVYLRVADTGRRIEDAIRPRIFDPFFTTKFIGRGLGLSAVQGIVHAHSGLIRVSSQPGQGSAFTCLLRVVRHNAGM
jgi:hypothetical protein